jgi:hypothetical protein
MDSYLPEESGYQKTIFSAMNYSVRAGGKRLRPILMEETYRLCGGEGKEIEPFMAAIEMIHTSSLVHDDLPAMDGDEYRRGKKTTWVVYGEDMGILAGDALMIYAFEVAAKAFGMTAHTERAGRAIGILAEKTGIYGMIGGQTVDVELTDTETYQLKEIPYKEKKGGKEFKRLELTRLDLPGGPVHVRNDHRNFYPIILNVFETCKKELAYFMKAVPMRETANFRPTQAYRELVDSMSALSACLQNKRIEQIRSFETMMDHHAIPFIREYLSIRKAVFDTFKKESAVFDERHIVLVDDGETNTLVDYSFMGARKIEGAENGDAGFPQEKDRSERWCFRLPRVFTKKDGKATADASCEKKQEPTCENDGKCGISSVKCLACLIKECNKIIGDKDTDDGAYDRHEYNQRSSITKYMHEVLRYRLLRCGYLDDEVSRACADPNFFYFERRSDSPDKSKVYCSKLARAIQMDPETIMDLELKKALCTVEHIRWNAYMRTEGYSFSMKRDDMAKTHPDMVQVQYLSMEDIRKDV